MEYLGYAASVFIGLVLGILGGGGSILSIPILVYLFAIEPVRATAYSLFVVGITSVAGSVPKYREGLVSIRTGFLFGIPSVLTIFSTRKWIVPAIPDVVLQAGDFIVTKRLLLLGLFAVLMVLAAIPMIRSKQGQQEQSGQVRIGMVILQGSFIGFLTGLVGAGGGFLIIPALVFFTGLSFKKAAGTSLFIIAMNSMMGFLGDVLNYPMDWVFLIKISALAVFGIFVGTRISTHLDGLLLRKVFGWLVLLMGIYILVREAL
ncbi:MAG: sulfite exporter TauE/SafE family protein [Cytophagales bacterium]|nr:sulfite exporter TauE/SafE family protein [Cytophagales bacterium]